MDTPRNHTETCCSPGAAPSMVAPFSGAREHAMRRALRLEYLTVSWNGVEGVIAAWAAVIAGSVALLGSASTALWSAPRPS